MSLIISRKRARSVTFDPYGPKRQEAMAKRRRLAEVRAVASVRQYRRNTMIPETKYFDTGFNVSVACAGADWASTEVAMDNYITSAGTVSAYTDSTLNPSAQGTGYGQIIGTKYNLKKLRIKGQLNLPFVSDQADVSSGGQCRLVLVMDNAPNGLQAQGEDIMQDMGAAGENLYSFTRMTTQASRFRILKDKTYSLPVSAAQQDSLVAATASNGFTAKSFKFQYTPKVPISVNIKTGNSTPTTAAMINCNIFLLAYATVGTSEAAVTISGCSRCYFID